MRNPTPEEEHRLMQAKKAMAGSMLAVGDRYELSGPELLALCAFVTGAVLAQQDQRTMTVRQAMDLVSRNIAAGHAAVEPEVPSGDGAPN